MTRLMRPRERGTQTSIRPVRRASTISSATSSGVISFTTGDLAYPAIISVLTMPGMTIEKSMPVPSCSARTASVSPTTACFVAT